MMHRTSLRLALVMIAAAILPASAAPSVAADDEQTSIVRWTLEIWDAALHGDYPALERCFDAIPTDASGEGVSRFRHSRDRLLSNRLNAAEQRSEKRAEAFEKMRQEFESGDTSEALAEAIKIQSLSEDLDSAFDEPEIMELISSAEQRVPVAHRQRAWLEAQELLYLLRTFYDDTDRRDKFEHYKSELEQVNRRVGLLARYTPARLHEMRNQRLLERGEEPLGDYNPASMLDWRDRLEGVTVGILRASLNTTAYEHIETAGWRPLLEGGLKAVRLLATTNALADTFPALADAGFVNRWIRHIDEELGKLAETDDVELLRRRRAALEEILNGLVALNQETLDLPLEVIYREFGDGAMDALDQYSEIIWPDNLRRFQQATQGNFVGVGILIRHNDKREILVVNPLEGTPAYFAGIKPNDLIVEVEGDSTIGWSLNDAVDRITGPKGTIVTLGIRREGVDDILQIPIQRDLIKIRSVKGWWKERLDENGDPVWDWYIDPLSRIAYIRLTQFTDDSYNDLRAAWDEITRDGDPNGLVLDLRHNPGGLLTSAVSVSNLFVRHGGIVSGEDKNGNPAWIQSAKYNRAEWADVPTVVLINQGSASASEIVAGCLQAHGAAVIIGERTFGKGSVQTVQHIARNARLKLTTQYYRLPSRDGGITPGRLVHKRPGAKTWGVDPDVRVPMSDLQVIEAIELRQAAEIIPLDEYGNLNPDDPDRPDVNDLLTSGIDTQLETALLILRARALATEHVRHASRRNTISDVTPAP